MMIKTLFSVALVLCLAACSAPLSGARPTATPVKSGTIRVGFTSAADLSDVPTLMALERLRARGYSVETQFFEGADLQVAALTKGDLDFGNGSTRTHWNAVAKGAYILTIMEEAADAWSLVAKNEIKTCADLNARRVAYSGSGAVNAALLSAYLQQNCPGTKPNILTISDSGARATALLAGELDATPLELANVLDVQQQAPEKYHTLVTFSEALPRLKTTGVHVRGEFAKQHPDMVHDYLVALLTVERDIRSNPKLLADAVTTFLKMDPAQAAQQSGVYLKNNIWDVNGGLTSDAVAYSVDFFIKSGALPPGLTAAKVSDLSYLDAVLNEIGRK